MKVDEFASISSVGDAVSQLFESPESRGKMSLGRQASLAWFKVNGDVERAHTCGVYIRRPRRPGELPVLGVYVDSASRAADFNASRENYLARLAGAGLRFADIRFEKTHRPPTPREPLAKKPARPAAPPRPPEPLDPASEAYARRLTADLPDSLREKAYKAMCASLRASKAESRGDTKTRP